MILSIFCVVFVFKKRAEGSKCVIMFQVRAAQTFTLSALYLDIQIDLDFSLPHRSLFNGQS